MFSSVAAKTRLRVLRSLWRYERVWMVWSRRPDRPPSKMMSYCWRRECQPEWVRWSVGRRTPRPSVFSFSDSACTHFIKSVES